MKDAITIIFPSYFLSSRFNVKGSAGPIGSRGDSGFEGPVVSTLRIFMACPNQVT